MGYTFTQICQNEELTRFRFRFWASDITGQDFNQSGDLFTLRLANAETPVNVTLLSITGGNPILTWPVLPGRSYQVQFKNNLTDTNWQAFSGSISIIGNDGFAIDIAPSPFQRYYRVVG